MPAGTSSAWLAGATEVSSSRGGSSFPVATDPFPSGGTPPLGALLPFRGVSKDLLRTFCLARFPSALRRRLVGPLPFAGGAQSGGRSCGTCGEGGASVSFLAKWPLRQSSLNEDSAINVRTPIAANSERGVVGALLF